MDCIVDVRTTPETVNAHPSIVMGGTMETPDYAALPMGEGAHASPENRRYAAAPQRSSCRWCGPCPMMIPGSMYPMPSAEIGCSFTAPPTQGVALRLGKQPAKTHKLTCRNIAMAIKQQDYRRAPSQEVANASSASHRDRVATSSVLREDRPRVFPKALFGSDRPFCYTSLTIRILAPTP